MLSTVVVLTSLSATGCTRVGMEMDKCIMMRRLYYFGEYYFAFTHEKNGNSPCQFRSEFVDKSDKGNLSIVPRALLRQLVYMREPFLPSCFKNLQQNCSYNYLFSSLERNTCFAGQILSSSIAIVQIIINCIIWCNYLGGIIKMLFSLSKTNYSQTIY